MSTPTLSPAPSSISHLKQRRTTTRATIFLITLTLACCLLATSSSTCLAAPARARVSKSFRQRSLSHQVHHVQVADESVHNTVILLKKSIQKRNSPNKRQQQPQQQEKKVAEAAGTNEAKKTKRHGKREIVDSVPENRNNKARRYTASTSSSSSSTLDDDDNDASTVSVVDNIATSSSIPSDHATIHPTHNNNSNKKKQLQKKKHRAVGTRLLSAYESIVFSESQIPVFLTQDRHHHHRQQKQRTIGLRVQQKGHVRIRKGAEAAMQVNNKNAQRHHQNPIRADTTDGEASSPFSSSSPVDDDNVTVAQADDAHLSASSSSNVLDSGTEYSVTQDATSNNNILQSDHVDDQGDVVGVTFSDDDKNSPSLGSPSHASTATIVVVQVEQEKEGMRTGELSAESTRIEAVVIEINEEGAIEGSPAVEEAVVQEEVVEDESTATATTTTTTTSSTASEGESESEGGWVTITNADLVSSNEEDRVSSIDSNTSSNIESQSPKSDDIPFIPFTSSSSSSNNNNNNNNNDSKPNHPTAAVAAGSSFFHNGCSSSSTIVSLGLLLTAIGLAYRFYIRKQRQQQKRRLILPLDTKTAPLLSSALSSSSKSVHRLSVDSLPSPTMRDGARTTAMRDYVGFNVQ